MTDAGGAPRIGAGAAERGVRDDVDSQGGAREGRGAEVVGGQVEPSEAVLAPRNRIVGWATDLGTPTTLVLLRHGETPGSIAKLFSGRGGHDHELTELGRQQAQRAAAALAARGELSAIVSSPLRRCRETAAFAAEVLGLGVEIDEGLAEAAFGAWDGLTYEQVERRWPTELADWLGRTSVAPPGGESMDEVESRVRAARDRILAAHPGESVLVVAHVNPVKSLVRAALGAPPEAIYHMAMAPASLTELDYYPDGTQVLRCFGVAAHLIGATSARGG